MIRGIIQSVVEGLIKRFTASGRPDETITNREYFQHYGYTSRPLADAEAVIINEGNHFVMIASDDRRYRIAIEAGEVCLYTDEGDHIRFKRGKEIYIKSGNKLTVDATNQVTITAPVAIVTTSTRCQVTSPEINLSGDRVGLLRLIDERLLAIFNAHTHPEHDGFNTGTPTQTLSTANTCTNITRAA